MNLKISEIEKMGFVSKPKGAALHNRYEHKDLQVNLYALKRTNGILAECYILDHFNEEGGAMYCSTKNELEQFLKVMERSCNISERIGSNGCINL